MILAAARICAPKGHEWEPDCARCQVDPERRVEWGCDAPAREPVLWISPCPHCNGGRDTCAHCEGTDRMPVHRCPNVLVTSRELDAVQAASMVEHGVLPDPGGWQDQPATFVRAFPRLHQEIRHWRGVALEQAQKKPGRR